MSLALALAPYFEKPMSVAAVYDEVLASAGRALALDPALAQPHVALGLAYEHNLEWDRAEKEFKTALALQAEDSEALLQYGRHFMIRGRLDDAMVQFRAARRADPEYAGILSHLAYVYYALRNQDSARVFSDLAIRKGALNLPTRNTRALILIRDGRFGEARELTNQMLTGPSVGYLLAASGDSAGAMEWVRALESERPRSSVVRSGRALTMLAFHDTTQALTGLMDATDAGEIWFMTHPPVLPIFDFVRASPRFAALLERLRLAKDTAAPMRAPGRP